MALIDKLDDDLKRIMADLLYPSELVDLLPLRTEDIIDSFEDLILENLEEIMEIAGIKQPTTDTDEYDG